MQSNQSLRKEHRVSELERMLTVLKAENTNIKRQNKEILTFNEKMNSELQSAIDALTVA